MKLKISESFYKSLFNNLLDGLALCQMLFDTQGRPIDWIYVEVNKNFDKLTGLKEVTGKKVTKLIPEITTSNPELFKIYSRVSLTGKPERFETYIKPLSKWFLISVYCPQKKFFVAVFENITDRKVTEKNLENERVAIRNVLEDLSVEKLKVEMAKAKEEAILMSIGDGLLATDEKGNITFINKKAEKLLGKKREEVMAKVFSEVILMEDEKGVSIPLEKRPINMVLATSTTTTTTDPIYYYVRKDRTKFPVAMMVTPIILGGKTIGTIEIFRDITREKEIDKAKSEFVSLASHQLKTPPTAIKLLTERMLSGKTGKLTEKQREYLNDIYSENQRSIELVNALLSVSRIEMGAFTIELNEKNIYAVVQGILCELKSTIDKNKLKLEETCLDKSTTILIDEALFRMVINNLIMNAINYTAEGGTIHVECREVNKEQTLGGKSLKENSFVVTISDTGCGIPKSQQDKLFTKFFRADNARKKHPDGTGLGLYIVKSILDNSGGSIWFTSPTIVKKTSAGKEKNRGTTFYVAIPITGMKAKIGKK